MKPKEIEQLRTKAAAGEVITQQETHDMLAEILRLREALEDCREYLAGDVAGADGDPVSMMRKIASALNGDAP
jgi:hypothetical protein